MRQFLDDLGAQLTDELVAHRDRDLLGGASSGSTKRPKHAADRVAETSLVLSGIGCCRVELVDTGLQFRLLVSAETEGRRNLGEEFRELPDASNSSTGWLSGTSSLKCSRRRSWPGMDVHDVRY